MREIHVYLHRRAKVRDGYPPSKAALVKWAGTAPAFLRSHKMWSEPDYAYLREKGYSDPQIKELWDRDTNGPVKWNKKPPNPGDSYGQQTIYKGFTITELANGKFTIHKDKTVIQHETPTLQSAKAIVDQLV